MQRISWLTMCFSAARNVGQSPLFRLPPEVRKIIWNHLLGEQVLHVESEGYKGPGEWQVKWRVFSYADQELGDQVRNLRRQRKLMALTHARLSPTHNSDHLQDFRYETPQLQILRVCRQAYLEANPVLWSTNTFSFEDAFTFRYFTENRKSVQKALLCNLRVLLRRTKHIHMTQMFRGRTVREWSNALRNGSLNCLRALTHVELAVDLRLKERQNSKPLNPDDRCFHFSGFRKLQRLRPENLKITFACGRGPRTRPSSDDLKWAAELCQYIFYLKPKLDKTPQEKRKQEKRRLRTKNLRDREKQTACFQKSSEADCISYRQLQEDRRVRSVHGVPKRIKVHCGRRHSCVCSEPSACSHPSLHIHNPYLALPGDWTRFQR